MRYRVGIIGCGRMAGTIDDETTWEHPDFTLPYGHVNGYKAVPETEVVAAADVDAAKLHAWCDRFGVPARYTDYREMIEEERLDIVSITVPATFRAAPLIYAAEHGVKGIYAEKALCASTTELDAILSACRRHGTHLAYGPMRRYWSGYQTVRRVLEEGVLGAPQAVVAPCASLFHSMSHLFDVAMYLLGDPEPEWVQGTFAGDPAGVVDDEGTYRLDKDPNPLFALVQFAGGSRIVCTEIPRGDLEIVCEKGIIRGQGDGAKYTMRRREPGSRTWTELPFPSWEKRSGTIAIIRDLVQAIETGRPGHSNLETARRGMSILFALVESHRQGGRRVQVAEALAQKLRVHSK